VYVLRVLEKDRSVYISRNITWHNIRKLIPFSENKKKRLEKKKEGEEKIIRPIDFTDL